MKSNQLLNKKVYIIILNWNQKGNTIETLDSLRKLTYSDIVIVIVDNNSTDSLQEVIKNNYPEVVLIENKENLGYAEGNNVGIRYCLKQGADYIFILNNDIILDAGSLSILIEKMEKDKNIGIAGPKTYFYLKKDVIQSMGGILDKNYNSLHIGRDEIDRGQFEKNIEVNFVTGSAMLMKREVFEKIGLFDSKYFMYWEETDLCFRAKKAGFNILIVPQSKIWHKGGSETTPLITYYMIRNQFLFLKNNLSLSERWAPFTVCLFNNIRSILSDIKCRKFINGKIRCLAFFDYILNNYGKKINI